MEVDIASAPSSIALTVPEADLSLTVELLRSAKAG